MPTSSIGVNEGRFASIIVASSCEPEIGLQYKYIDR